MPCQSKLHWAAIKLITGTRPRRCSILQSLEIDFPKFLDTPSYYCLVELKLRYISPLQPDVPHRHPSCAALSWRRWRVAKLQAYLLQPAAACSALASSCTCSPLPLLCTRMREKVAVGRRTWTKKARDVRLTSGPMGKFIFNKCFSLHFL